MTRRIGRHDGQVTRQPAPSAFVLIGQNRQAAFQQAKADRDVVESELELEANTELTRQIHALVSGRDREERVG